MKVTSTDMKNKFGEYLRLCATEPVYITKNGKTIAKLLNHSEEDGIVEDSVNLRNLYKVDMKINKDYEYKHVEEAIEAYNLDRIKMTYEEFSVMNEDSSNRYEFIDGEVYVLAVPSVYHQRIVSIIHIAFDTYLIGKPCDIFESPFDVTLFRKQNKKFTNIVQPDLLVICDWEKDVNERGRYIGTPDLVIEVLSPGNTVKEMITKLDLYRHSGIKEYWIVDDVKKQGIIYQFDNYEIVNTNIVGVDEPMESFIYKGLKVNLN